MKNVLLYYSFGFSLGGGEFLPLAFIAALQKTCDLTVAVDVARNFERSYRAFGAGLDIDVPNLRIVQVTPPDYNPRRNSVFVSLYRFRRLKRLARAADVCISTACIMDFGRPAHHFINMLDFGDGTFNEYVRGADRAGLLARAKRLLSSSVLRPLLGMRSRRSVICDRRQRIYPNSLYVERLMKGFYGQFAGETFYPPTLFAPEPRSAWRDPLKVVFIGRIIPAKRVDALVLVVEKARAATGLDLTFHVAGRLDQTPSYGKSLEKMAEGRKWLRFAGELHGGDKAKFLTSGSYALHAERDEAFGISVAEYLVAGLVPVVPDEGGTPEVVGSPELSYRDFDEAAATLARLVSDAAFRERMRLRCAERAKLFTREAYFARQRELLGRIVGT